MESVTHMKKVQIDNYIKIDKRTHNTHIKLLKALTNEFSNGTNFDNLNVQKLCKSAKISRATFYRHHQDMTDILTVEYLILIQNITEEINNLSSVSYSSISNIIVTNILKKPTLPELVEWAHCRDRIIPLINGIIQRVMISIENISNLHFISEFIGNDLYQFSLQIAKEKTLPNRQDTLNLFLKIIPNLID